MHNLCSTIGMRMHINWNAAELNDSRCQRFDWLKKVRKKCSSRMWPRRKYFGNYYMIFILPLFFIWKRSNLFAHRFMDRSNTSHTNTCIELIWQSAKCQRNIQVECVAFTGIASATTIKCFIFILYFVHWIHWRWICIRSRSIVQCTCYGRQNLQLKPNKRTTRRRKRERETKKSSMWTTSRLSFYCILIHHFDDDASDSRRMLNGRTIRTEREKQQKKKGKKMVFASNGRLFYMLENTQQLR